MKTFCDIYRSNKDEGMYVYVKFGKGLEALPASLLKKLGTPTKIMSLELSPERKLARVDVNRVLEKLTEQGFYLQMPPSHFNAESSTLFGDAAAIKNDDIK